jgi:hypothetical protein
MSFTFYNKKTGENRQIKGDDVDHAWQNLIKSLPDKGTSNNWSLFGSQI